MEEQPPVRARLRRWYVPNAIYFITCVTHERRPFFDNADDLELLRDTMRQARDYHPFKMHSYALMPNHFHLLIQIPETTNVSKLLQSIQWNTTRKYKQAHHLTGPLHLWQRGFWDHVIRNAEDYERHFNYIHYNPIKHGLATSAGDYPHTSFQEYVRRGWYGPTWAQGHVPLMVENGDFEP
ncbi:MAG: transposase [Chloroflexi bacterium]|jgi:putative transposase|nr:transposase [Chloroflexota bacterium]